MGLQLVVPLWLLQPSLLFHISQVCMTNLGSHPIIPLHPPVQKVLKSAGRMPVCHRKNRSVVSLLFLSFLQKRHTILYWQLYISNHISYYALPDESCFFYTSHRESKVQLNHYGSTAQAWRTGFGDVIQMVPLQHCSRIQGFSRTSTQKRLKQGWKGGACEAMATGYYPQLQSLQLPQNEILTPLRPMVNSFWLQWK